MHQKWKDYLIPKFQEPYMVKLMDFIRSERAMNKRIYPDQPDLMNAFEYCSYDKLMVVILGLEPYSTPFHNNGLAFASVNNSYPEELKNIFRETWYAWVAKMDRRFGTRKVDYKGINPSNQFHAGDLTEWARQGVLLWNIIGTVQQHHPLSHSNRGWERFTAETLEFISSSKENIVFLLWGKNAGIFKPFIKQPEKHLILESAHPSKGKEGFLGNYHFNYLDHYISKNHNRCIQWWVLPENNMEEVPKAKEVPLATNQSSLTQSNTEKPWKEIVPGVPF